MIRVHPATEHDRPAWDAYVEAHPDGLAYHRWAWKDAVERAYGFDGLYLAARRGRRICGVLPTVHHRLPLTGGSLVSLPYCDVGGVLAADDEVEQILVAEALRWADRLGAKALELRQAESPGDDPGRNGTGQPPTANRQQPPAKVRMLLPLPDSAEALMAGFKAKHRSQVRKPARDGLSSVLGGRELLDSFYRVFAENMRDLGSPVHSRRWIQEVVSSFGDHARVGIVRLPDGTPAAGGVILTNGRTVSIPWASSLRRYNRQNPNMLLYWTFLAWAADHGFDTFDFGRSTVGEGTYKFKEQWGARPAPLSWRLLSSRGGTACVDGLSQSRLRMRAEQVWSRLPLGASVWLGGRLRPFVSL